MGEIKVFETFFQALGTSSLHDVTASKGGFTVITPYIFCAWRRCLGRYCYIISKCCSVRLRNLYKLGVPSQRALLHYLHRKNEK